MISEDNVVEILEKTGDAGICVWVAGGWGVDALLGRQTRPHHDFDIFAEKKDESAFVDIFRTCGYRESQKHNDDNTAWTNSDGSLIDFHLFEFVEAGNMQHDNARFPADIFDGNGFIGGIAVRCMTAEAQISYRHGYELREKDVQDVLLLCEAFDRPIPEGFDLFR